MDDLIRRIEAGGMSDYCDITVLCAPTGGIQEVAESSGWGQEFLSLAKRFDAAVEAISSSEKAGKDTSVLTNPRVIGIYRFGTRSVLPILFSGGITLTVASITGSKRGVHVGSTIFIMAFVIWGFSSLQAIVWALVQTLRETGIKSLLRDCASNPAVAVVLVMESLMHCIFGFGGLWTVLKIIALNK
ncbi:MAG: hypothetical protein JWM16_4540 [Verrucomicrobiales bacterium]|nr:hypothetical protein [Verrucomicrobiales bacterium]